MRSRTGGKYSVPERAKPRDGRLATLTGVLLKRGDLDMLEGRRRRSCFANLVGALMSGSLRQPFALVLWVAAAFLLLSLIEPVAVRLGRIFAKR
jgi:hypothetical protein